MKKYPGITPQEIESHLQTYYKLDEIPRKVVIKRWMNEMRTKIMGHIREPADVCLSFNTLRKTIFGRR